MRIFIRYSVALFRQKTERVEVSADTLTDQLIEIAANRSGKADYTFALTYRQQQNKVRIVKGWQLSHYNIRAGTTLVVEAFEDSYTMPQDSMKARKMLMSVMPGFSTMDLSRIEEVNQQNGKDDALTTIKSQSVFQSQDEAILRTYLDEQLEMILKETQKGKLEQVSRLFKEWPLMDNPELAERASILKQTVVLNELGANGWGIIHTAAYYNHPDILSFLLIKNADPNVVTTDGWTALQLSVLKKSFTMVKSLLEYPSTMVNLLTCRGSALHIAVREELPDIVKLLMSNKANEHLNDEDGHTPLDLADNKEILRLLNQEQEVQEKKKGPDGFLQEPPPVMIGNIYKQAVIYGLDPKFLVCNPYEGTLIYYDDEDDYPRKPAEVIPLVSIINVRIVPKREYQWLMKKSYYYFQIFYKDRLILGLKHEQLAKRWVKGIFESSVFAITHENKHKQLTSMAQTATTLVLNDTKGVMFDKQKVAAKKKESKKQIIVKKSEFSLMKEFNEKSRIADQPVSNLNNGKHLQQSPSPQLQESKIQESPQKQDLPSIEEPKPIKTAEKPYSVIFQENARMTQKKPSVEETPEFKLKDESPKTTTTTINQQPEEPTQKVKFSSFELLRQIGSGSFGKVFEAKLKSNGKIYALKALHKKTLMAKKGLKYAFNEAEILKSTDHPFIVKMHYSFQTMNYLYMCMDYCSRGDLSRYIAEKEILAEEQVCSIIAQIILALEYLHDRNIVYRDMKPENMLVGADGYIKLADFGLSKEMSQENSCKTFCGSLAYLSPEMLNNKEVGKHSDVYGVGCIMYELLSGQPPYYDVDMHVLQQNIRQGKLRFSQGISSTAKDLLLKFLQRDISKRITLKEAKAHIFFKGLNFELLLKKEIGQMDLPIESAQDSDEDEQRTAEPRPKFVDYDYPQSKSKKKVVNYSFTKADG